MNVGSGRGQSVLFWLCRASKLAAPRREKISQFAIGLDSLLSTLKFAVEKVIIALGGSSSRVCARPN